MILEKQTEALVQQDGEINESIGMSLDLDSAHVLMQMLSKNLYSDAIGSTVRECASNALDSHRRAGTDKPIVVALKATKDGTYEFSVEDFGIGLDADDVKNIISKYGKSTKRNSSTELGMMGLGFKAPLAYTSSFYFVARKNGMERKYMMYEGEDTNTIDLLYEAPTDQPNGVKVIIPVKWGDRYSFTEKIKEQLAYFESVYFDVDGISNDFTIIRHEHFQFSPLASDRYMHICLDNVYYPIDFGKLEIDRIFLPVGLRFSLTDGIFPTPNREAIRYTQEAKNIILNKLKQAADYFIEKYNENIQETEDLKVIIDHFHNKSRHITFGKSSWDVNPLSRFSTISFKAPSLKGIKLLDLQQIVRAQDYILGEYDAKFFVNSKVMRDAKRYYNPTAINRLPKTVYVYYSDKISGVKKDYLKSLQHREEALIVRKARSFPLRRKSAVNDYDNYYSILKLGNYPKSQWRAVIQEFQSIIDSYVKTFVNIDEIVVPQSFIDSRKKNTVTTISGGPKQRRLKLKGEIVCKQAQVLERWVDGKQCKWVSTIYDMSKFHQNKFVLVYGKQGDAEQMDKWFKATRSHNVEFAILSERELKIVKDLELHNLIPFSKFMEGKNKPFQRIATACAIDQLRDKYRAVFNKSQHLEQISSDLHKKIELLAKYHNDHFRGSMDASMRDIIVNHAKEVKAFDLEIYHIFEEVEEVCTKLAFLDPILDNMSNWKSNNTTNVIQALTDLFKYHKHRIDWKNYKIKLNEDLPLEETLTTETVEELVDQN